MNLEQFSHKKLFQNDIFEENLVKFGNHVETKPLEPVLWNFAWINGRLYSFRWYKAEIHKIDIFSLLKISFVTVVFDDRVTKLLVDKSEIQKPLRKIYHLGPIPFLWFKALTMRAILRSHTFARIAGKLESVLVCAVFSTELGYCLGRLCGMSRYGLVFYFHL